MLQGEPRSGFTRIATGLYLNTQEKQSTYDSDFGKNNLAPIIFSPRFSVQNKLDGADVRWLAFRF